METITSTEEVAESLFTIIEKLPGNDQKEVLSKLQKKMVMRKREEPSHDDLDKIFGGFISEKTAEQIIEEIYSSRTFARDIESFD